MLLEIAGKVVSSELFTLRFVCDVRQCHGMCCYEGDGGAPLAEGEKEQIEALWPDIKPLLPAEQRRLVRDMGYGVLDEDGDLVTPLVAGRQCVYALRDADGCWACAIEKLWHSNHTAFRKPLSCQLYPIRVCWHNDIETLEIHHWRVCRGAEARGEAEGLPVFRFLKDAIVRAWGEDFFHELELAEAAVIEGLEIRD